MFKSHTLGNGLKIITVKMPHMESISLGLWINTGVRNERKATNGISHMLEHLVFKGTKKRGAIKLKQDIEGRGGSFNGFTAEEFTCYLAKVLAKDLELGMDVLSDMALDPLLKEYDIAKEKHVIIEEINMYRDMPSHYIHELLTEVLWPNHPLGLPLAGTVESVGSISRRDLIGYHAVFYVPANMVIAAAGNLKDQDIVELSKKYLSRTKGFDGPQSPAAFKTQSRPEVMLHYKKTEQTHMAIGVHAPHRFHPDRYIVSLLNVILGANMSSRLFQEVREKKALCYEIGSSIRRYRDAAAFVVNAGVDYEKLPEALEVILSELERLKRKCVGGEELKRAKEYYKGQLMLALEDTMSAMLWYGEKAIAEEKECDIREILRKIDSIGGEDICRVAASIFTDDNLNLAVIGPIKERRKIDEVLRIR